MIVKFHARGKGGGSGPVDYLLGRERNREGATVLQGNPEEVRELIDATPFAKAGNAFLHLQNLSIHILYPVSLHLSCQS